MSVDPFVEIVQRSLRSVPGPNYWLRGPITRLDLRIGAYEEISSAEVPGLTDALLAGLPGLAEHACSVGRRGGFIERLRRGTYAPHMVEHVALELQDRVGHAVAFGRARGLERGGEYLVVIEHRHAAVGRRAASGALDVVRRAFAGRPLDLHPLLDELSVLAASPEAAPERPRVLCAVTGGPMLDATRRQLASRFGGRGTLVAVTPGEIFDEGLPYARSRLAVIADSEATGVAAWYRSAEASGQLLSVVAEAVEPGGLVIVPAGAAELRRRVRESPGRYAVFAAANGVEAEERRDAEALCRVRNGRIVVQRDGDPIDLGALDDRAPVPAQLATALAAFLLDGRDDPLLP